MSNYVLDILRGIFSRMGRPFRNFNIEDRALKAISREKPISAPRFKADEESLKKIYKENPQIIQELSKKNMELDNRLKDVYVTSVDIKPIAPVRSSANLPTNRKVVEYHDYGCKEPEIIPEGRVTLRDTLQFLNDHNSDKEQYSSTYIADKYKLDKDTVDLIVEYYKPFDFYIPKRLMQTPPSKWNIFLRGKKATESIETKGTAET